ncbi:VanZ family protein [Thomasclavelia cocleata]|uniref:VanZ like family protein n=1 Tax=Thomasclavelia cocleata TaxID=69824 RepID=A0A1I0HYF3_9FIRM|nr:VanZ family protein [Thomasclavelia cocleata]MCR1961515.1 VanZ family protein [Thomasclavelia cocleata]NDO40903.1 VanZ family protein [Thomasclavelia cocleata]PJN80056.1 VanZ family protein [Thomasclavelia cocleata]SET89125.1 VanZ like family protein [Thomasclavelia cocleata]
MKKLKYFIPAIIWMIFIFIMSHTNGNESSNQSNFIVKIVLEFININHETLSFMIRKIAHMSEYAILLLFIYYGLYKTITYKYQLLISLLITFIYACSDEFHQLFIPGRSGQFMDVLIDTSGALIMLLIIYLWQKRKKPNQ